MCIQLKKIAGSTWIVQFSHYVPLKPAFLFLILSTKDNKDKKSAVIECNCVFHLFSVRLTVYTPATKWWVLAWQQKPSCGQIVRTTCLNQMWTLSERARPLPLPEEIWGFLSSTGEMKQMLLKRSWSEVFLVCILIKSWLSNADTVRFSSSLFCSTFSEEKSRFLGVLKGRKFIWAWDWDVACGHCVPIGHQTRPDVRRACGSKEAAILQLRNNTTGSHCKKNTLISEKKGTVLEKMYLSPNNQ